VNATQIENVGFIMMANETNALKMLQQYDAKYILVFHTLALSQSGQTYVVGPGRWGDEGKWTWMAKISGEASNRFINKSYVDAQSSWTDEKPFGNYSLGKNWIDANHNGQVDSGELSAAPLGLNSTIYKLMSWAKQRWVDTSGTPNGIVIDEAGVQPDYFKEAYFSGLDTSPFAYGGIIPLVALYEIDWQKYYNATGTTG